MQYTRPANNLALDSGTKNWNMGHSRRTERVPHTCLTVTLTTPSSPTVGNPSLTPAPTAAFTLSSGGPSTFAPFAVALSPSPLPPLPPRPLPSPPKNRSKNCLLPFLPLNPLTPTSSSTPTPAASPSFVGGAAAVPINAPTMTAALTGPLPWVRPRGVARPERISRSRIMAVSAWEPQRLGRRENNGRKG